MGKNNFYAVKEGHTTGIFPSWEECQAATNGYPRAIYKGFPTEIEAKAFLDGEDLYLQQVKADIDSGFVVAYTDGSYDAATNRYAYGVCIFDSPENEIDLCNIVKYEPFASSRNIAGEIYGVLTALDWAVSNGYSKIKIYYDYAGIEKWVTGEYSADSDIASHYVNQLSNKYKDIIDIVFVKVQGHSNNPYNDKADLLAKNALKGERKMIKGANSFLVHNFHKQDIDIIIGLILEENAEYKAIRTDILGGEQIKLKIGNKHTMIKMYNNNKLLVQGKPNMPYQVVFTYISELLGEKKAVPLVKQAYRISVDLGALDNNYNNFCPNIPPEYNSSIITLMRQAIINLNGYFEAEEYGQYAFPALRAMEGHIKYLFDKVQIRVIDKFNHFTGNEANGYSLKPDFDVKSPYKDHIEQCYNFYHKTRHKIFHFGDIIGRADNTMLITDKEQADEIIIDALRLINRTVY